MRAGRLNQSLLVRRNAEMSPYSSFGEPTLVPSDRAAWGEVFALQGREFQAVQQRWAEARFRVTMRYLDDVKAADQIIWGTRTLDILDVEADAKNRQLVMYCREIA
jgi:SPP1 family predicted phage head-tail adaptor